MSKKIDFNISQVRFCVKLLQYPELMPSKKVMLEEYNQDVREAKEKNIPSRKMHEMTIPAFQPYLEELGRVAYLDKIPPVLFKLSTRAFDLMINEFGRFRRYTFEIIDDENFVEKFN